MAHTVQYMGSSLISSSHIHFAKIYAVPTDEKCGTSGEVTWLIWCHADLLVFSVRWALAIFLR